MLSGACVPCHSSGRNHLYSTAMTAASPLPPPADPAARPCAGPSSPSSCCRSFGAAGALAYRGGPTHWSRWDRTVTSRLPAAAAHPEARVLVMSGRTRGWKGAVAVHSWIVIKRENDATWRRYDVVGWGNPVRLNWWPPDLLVRRARRPSSSTSRARRPQALIPRIEAAIKDYQLRQCRRLPDLAGPEQQHLRRDRAARRAGARRHAAAERGRPRLPRLALCRA